jgi:hypothetical protein
MPTTTTTPTGYVLTKDNRRRRKQGRQAARAGAADSYDPTDPPTAITDALVNLMHYAEEIGVSFDTHLRVARNHYTAERTGEE